MYKTEKGDRGGFLEDDKRKAGFAVGGKRPRVKTDSEDSLVWTTRNREMLSSQKLSKIKGTWRIQDLICPNPAI